MYSLTVNIVFFIVKSKKDWKMKTMIDFVSLFGNERISYGTNAEF